MFWTHLQYRFLKRTIGWKTSQASSTSPPSDVVEEPEECRAALLPLPEQLAGLGKRVTDFIVCAAYKKKKTTKTLDQYFVWSDFCVIL